MADPTAGLSALETAGSNLASTLLTVNQQKLQSEQNEWSKDISERQFEYQQYLNNLTMAREDTAVQRRMEDLARAGLNPNLAVGNAAGSSSLTTGGGSHSPSQKVQDLRFQSITGAFLDAQARMQQTDLMRSQEAYYNALAGKVEADTSLSGMHSAEISHNLEFYRKHGLPTNASSWTKTATGIMDWFDNAARKVTSNAEPSSPDMTPNEHLDAIKKQISSIFGSQPSDIETVGGSVVNLVETGKLDSEESVNKLAEVIGGKSKPLFDSARDNIIKFRDWLKKGRDDFKFIIDNNFR